MLLGSVPDYVQGILKWIWVSSGRSQSEAGKSSTRLHGATHYS
jgi:hypothetical protein